MKLLLLSFALLLILDLSDGRGGRGGGSRGGSRGSSSRGSSSRGSSSRGSSSSSQRGTTYERKTSNSESAKPPVVPTAPKLPDIQPVNTRVKPSAPDLSQARPQPSAPNLPNQGSVNQPAYNPNYRNPAPGQVPPPYPGPSQGRPPPYPGNNQAPPPGYPGVNQGAPPPYPGGNAGRPPYGTNQGPPPPYPGGPQYGQMPNQAGARPYPQQSNTGINPYPRQPGLQPNYGNRPYPQQPGMNPSYGMPAPSYTQYSGLPMGGGSYTKPYKKKGLLGQLFSGSKPKTHYGGYPKHSGGHFGGGHKMSPAMYPIIPMMMMKSHKPKFFKPSFPRPFIFMPFPMYGFHHHHHYGSHYYDIYDDNYRGGCRRPFVPKHGHMECNTTHLGAKCKANCQPGYSFANNITEKENECWHVGGVWRPTRSFGNCEPICLEKCENGGKCGIPGVCSCDPEYRGEHCEYHIMNCDIRKLAGKNSNNISWTCQHSRNETVCQVRCRNSSPSIPLEAQNVTTVLCQPTGQWSADTLPNCGTSESEIGTTEKPEDTTKTIAAE